MDPHTMLSVAEATLDAAAQVRSDEPGLAVQLVEHVRAWLLDYAAGLQGEHWSDAVSALAEEAVAHPELLDDLAALVDELVRDDLDERGCHTPGEPCDACRRGHPCPIPGCETLFEPADPAGPW